MKTVIRRHVAPGVAVPLHPTAAAFAGHYGFSIDVLAAYRPTGKGRVERQVDIVREHVLAGREFDALAEMNSAFTAWLPIRRASVHRTHGEVIGVRAETDRAALLPLPGAPFLVDDKHLRRVGKDCLVSFDASLYSVPARRVRAGQTVELRVLADVVTIHALDGELLARHARAATRGSWVVDPTHWDEAARRSHPRHRARAGAPRPGALVGSGDGRAAGRVAAAPAPARRECRVPPVDRLRDARRGGDQPMSSLVTDRIREHATRLGLTHLTDTVTQLVERADAEQMGYLDFVDLLLEEELGLREGRRFRNALKLSGLPHHKTIDEFDFTFPPDLDPRKVRDLATLAFIDAKSNIALLGPPGVGKTMLAVGLAVAACRAGYSIYFPTLDDLVRRLRAAEATGRLNRQLAAYLRPSVLIVDEVGYLPLDRAEANREIVKTCGFACRDHGHAATSLVG
jgi:DNA replication protein DnaC